MGNKASRRRRLSSIRKLSLSFNRSHDSDGPEENVVNEEVRRTFEELSADKRSLAHADLETKFGKTLSTCLWDFLVGRDNGKRSVTAEEFYAKAHELLEMPRPDFIGLLLPADRLLKVCLEVNEIKRRPEDGPFLASLVTEMTSKGDSVEAIGNWIEDNCPHLCDGVHEKVVGTFGHTSVEHGDFESSILTPVQVLILRNALPSAVYFAAKTSKDGNENCKEECKCWEPLYVSNHHGLSINRFETHVFHYRGPTVAIFRMLDGRVCAIACDDEWRYHDKNFGGPHSALIQVLPSFKRFVASEAPIYCNFKLHMAPYGIKFGCHDDFHIDAEMGNVDAIEVWGCAGTDALHQQKEHRHWMQLESTKSKKMDESAEDNVDRKILQMRRPSLFDDDRHEEAEERRRH
jgi:hypothetical protein